MPMYEYRCGAGHRFEQFFPLAAWETANTAPCECGRPAMRYLSKPPGVGWMPAPYFDQQLGCMVESRSHMERIAKERGLTIMGADDHRRTIANLRDDNGVLDKPIPALREAVEKTYNDLKYGNIEPPPPPMKLEEADAPLFGV